MSHNRKQTQGLLSLDVFIFIFLVSGPRLGDSATKNITISVQPKLG